MPQPILRPIVISAIALVSLARLSAQEIQVMPDHPDGIYQSGEVIRWAVQVKGGELSAPAFVLKRGGVTEMSQGKVVLTGGKGQVESKLEEPGWLLADITATRSDGKTVKSSGGALVLPGKIQPAVPRPGDFDAFWQSKLQELATIPLKPELTPDAAAKPNVDYFKITMDNIRGTRIRGQMARPKEGAKFPAMLIVQWAGVYPLQKSWVTDRAAEGWLALNLNAHDLPIDEPESFYQQQSSGPLKDYPAIHNDDREASYFLRMYLSCHRGAQYLTERPDWDGRTLVVTGGSQGGMQSFVAAALHPRITAVMANVPAGCDLNGPQAGRLPGWPMWYWATKDKAEAKVRSAAGYYDVVNFASRIKVPVLVGVGLIDTVCPSPGVLAACNQLQGPKEIVVLPLGEHGDKNGSHAPYYARSTAWSQALLNSNPLPLK